MRLLLPQASSTTRSGGLNLAINNDLQLIVTAITLLIRSVVHIHNFTCNWAVAVAAPAPAWFSKVIYIITIHDPVKTMTVMIIDIISTLSFYHVQVPILLPSKLGVCTSYVAHL